MAFLLLMFTLVPTADAVPIEPGMHDDRSDLFVYNVDWTEGTATRPVNGTYSRGNVYGDNVTFDTYSDGFTLFFLYISNASAIDVCVNATCTVIYTASNSVDFPSAPASGIRGQVDFTSLGTGLKNVSITIIDDPNYVTGDDFYFDAVYIHPYEAVEEETNVGDAITQDFTFENQPYVGALHLNLDAGDIMLILLMVVLVLVQLGSFITGIWQR